MKKVNEVSQLAGVSKRTLQFYDDEGLLPAERSEGNYRLYDDAALERLWQILVYREMELDLKEIKYLMTLSDKERNQFLREKIKKLKQQIKHLDGQMEFILMCRTMECYPFRRSVRGRRKLMSRVFRS